MYCLMVFNGAPPTVDTKYEFVHNVGSRFSATGTRRATTVMTYL